MILIRPAVVSLDFAVLEVSGILGQVVLDVRYSKV
jgi:hypothetical protein